MKEKLILILAILLLSAYVKADTLDAYWFNQMAHEEDDSLGSELVQSKAGFGFGYGRYVLDRVVHLEAFVHQQKIEARYIDDLGRFGESAKANGVLSLTPVGATARMLVLENAPRVWVGGGLAYYFTDFDSNLDEGLLQYHQNRCTGSPVACNYVTDYRIFPTIGVHMLFGVELAMTKTLGLIIETTYRYLTPTIALEEQCDGPISLCLARVRHFERAARLNSYDYRLGFRYEF